MPKFSLWCVCVCVCVCVCDSHAGCNLSYCLSWYAFQLNSTCTLGFVVVASLIYIAVRKPLAMSQSSPLCLVSRVPSFLRQWMVWSFQTCGVPGISAFPEGDNVFAWIGTIKGSLQLSMKDWPTGWHWSSLQTIPSNLQVSNLTHSASIPMSTNMATFALICCR